MSTQGTRTTTVTREITETRFIEASLVLQLLRRHFQILDDTNLEVQVNGVPYQHDVTLDELEFTLVTRVSTTDTIKDPLGHPDREGQEVRFPYCPEGGRCADQEHCMQGGSCKTAKLYAKKD